MTVGVDTKLCPYCGEEIKALAVKCRFCAERLDTQAMEPAALAAEPPVSAVLGYRLERLLGSGGMGSVYLGVNELLQQRVAIKVLDPALARSAEVRERFIQEARIQVNLRHPGIVQVLTADTQGSLALVLEYVDGPSLSDMLEEAGALPLPEALRLFRGVLDAVGHAHLAGIVHRDLKPANVLVQSNGQPKVTDFGIARVMTASRMTRTGAVMGTPHYMSPEQIRGLHDADSRSDIYSLGVMLFEMLTGRPPFDGDSLGGDSDFGIREAHVHREPPDPRTLRPEIPSQVARAVLRALAKRPEERFPSCEDFRAALEPDATASLKPAETESRRQRPVDSSRPVGPRRPGPASPAPTEAALEGVRAELAQMVERINLPEMRVGPQIDAKAQQVWRSHFDLEATEEILFTFDASVLGSVFGKAKKGLVLTPERLVVSKESGIQESRYHNRERIDVGFLGLEAWIPGIGAVPWLSGDYRWLPGSIMLHRIIDSLKAVKCELLEREMNLRAAAYEDLNNGLLNIRDQIDGSRSSLQDSGYSYSWMDLVLWAASRGCDAPIFIRDKSVKQRRFFFEYLTRDVSSNFAIVVPDGFIFFNAIGSFWVPSGMITEIRCENDGISVCVTGLDVRLPVLQQRGNGSRMDWGLLAELLNRWKIEGDRAVAEARAQ